MESYREYTSWHRLSEENSDGEFPENFIISLGTVLESVYPGNWDVQTAPDDNHIYVLIRFPQITISNSEGKSHSIRDLFVQLTFQTRAERNEVWFVYKLQGRRLKLNEDEYNSQYAHSHLPSGWGWNGFCTGSSSMHTALLTASEVTASNRNSWVQGPGRELWWNSIMAVLLELDSYVRWESVEGGPFHRIGNIKSRGQNQYLFDSSKKQAAMSIAEDHFYPGEKIKAGLGVLFNVEIYPLAIRPVRVIPTPAFDDLMEKHCPHKSFVYDDGKYEDFFEVPANTAREGIHRVRGIELMFRNQRLYLEVEQLIDRRQGKTVVPNRDVYKRVINYLENYFYGKYVTYTIESIKGRTSAQAAAAKRDADNFRETFVANLVSVEGT